VDGDGAAEVVVAGYGTRNLVLTWTGGGLVDIAEDDLADPGQRSTGVVAADASGGGLEELYLLGDPRGTVEGGADVRADRLMSRRAGGWVDLLELPANRHLRGPGAARSVTAIDRVGSGSYGFAVASPGGALRLLELSGDRLLDLAPEARVAARGVLAVLAAPLGAGGRPDLIGLDEAGGLRRFDNLGDGRLAGPLSGAPGSAQGGGAGILALLDLPAGLAVVEARREGGQRLWLADAGGLADVTPPALAGLPPAGTVLTADFDNDGRQELLITGLGRPNRLLGWRDGGWRELDPGPAAHPGGPTAAAAAADLDGDGRLELLLAGGPDQPGPLALYYMPRNDNGWLRIAPTTPAGAPARAALVELQAGGRLQRRVIDAGGGAGCQSEPVAHFGLGTERRIDRVRVTWPDLCTVSIESPAPNQLLAVAHPATRPA
jgi:ASPIC and UnbV/FG-GAP-like repeat